MCVAMGSKEGRKYIFSRVNCTFFYSSQHFYESTLSSFIIHDHPSDYYLLFPFEHAVPQNCHFLSNTPRASKENAHHVHRRERREFFRGKNRNCMRLFINSIRLPYPLFGWSLVQWIMLCMYVMCLSLVLKCTTICQRMPTLPTWR